MSSDGNGDATKEIDVWTWYLCHVRNGSFEEILGNEDYYKLLKNNLVDDVFNIDKGNKIFKLISINYLNNNILLDYYNNIVKKTLLLLNKSNSIELHYLVINGTSSHSNDDTNSSIASSIEINFKPKLSSSLNANAITSVNDNQKKSNQSPYSSQNTTELSSIDSFQYSEDVESLPSLSYEKNPNNNQAKYLISNNEQQDAAADTNADAEGDVNVEDIYLDDSDSDSLSSFPPYFINDPNFGSYFNTVLPTVNLPDPYANFQLVLQSILIYNSDSDELITAIRQSNNEQDSADIDDDWLLYDSKFSMTNLQILSLNELLHINKDYPKILFYSLVSIPNVTVNISNYENSSNPHLEDYINHSDDSLSIHDTPQQFYPMIVNDNNNNININNHNNTRRSSVDYYDDSIPQQFYPDDMNIPTKVNTNTTIAHRSYRTITNGSSSYINDGQELQNIITLTNTVGTEYPLAKYSTALTSSSKAERSKSRLINSSLDKISSVSNKSSNKSSRKSNENKNDLKKNIKNVDRLSSNKKSTSNKRSKSKRKSGKNSACSIM
ncbi:hypothetical protein Kpol_1023p99 [Vanderwaltozyma polyspora DSM 70294]|uniref:Protein GIS4 n=1 Tax=Vanderwaltozyma polyspora (strain ATCC 22028 / DSM 70294 / BCRC 21397 / CBS 2163 / NBRC 10782 / NRRL Y-8283 / UCD 57-17) TaxID=436907 RepID=A7TFW8_VANPO|nr:uncharacterized protein Kpol_1023p99 [Vanderwaltozyma polyspora DSM 70294]EDO18926.1 hypothetical protein Kpol_1023p99 [Vanderwaltozyma polyspora DSM 70294]